MVCFYEKKNKSKIVSNNKLFISQNSFHCQPFISQLKFSPRTNLGFILKICVKLNRSSLATSCTSIPKCGRCICISSVSFTSNNIMPLGLSVNSACGTGQFQYFHLGLLTDYSYLKQACLYLSQWLPQPFQGPLL